MIHSMQKIQSITNHRLAKALHSDYVSVSPNADIMATEKLDGANASFDSFGHIYSHRQKLSPKKNLVGFYGFLAPNLTQLIDLFKDELQADSFQIFGEWLIPHPTINYKSEKLNHWYLFDAYVGTEDLGHWVGFKTIQAIYQRHHDLFDSLGIKLPNVIYSGPATSLDALEQLAETNKTNSQFSTDGRMEGIVVTDYSDLTASNNPIRIKIVNNEYKETRSAPSRQVDSQLLWLDKYATDIRIQKLITADLDENGLVLDKSIFKTDYPKNLRDRVWQDILTESVDTPTDLNETDLKQQLLKRTNRNLGQRRQLESGLV